MNECLAALEVGRDLRERVTEHRGPALTALNVAELHVPVPESVLTALEHERETLLVSAQLLGLAGEAHQQAALPRERSHDGNRQRGEPEQVGFDVLESEAARFERADPTLVDLVVGAVGADASQAAVQLVEQRGVPRMDCHVQLVVQTRHHEIREHDVTVSAGLHVKARDHLRGHDDIAFPAIQGGEHLGQRVVEAQAGPTLAVGVGVREAVLRGADDARADFGERGWDPLCGVGKHPGLQVDVRGGKQHEGLAFGILPTGGEHVEARKSASSSDQRFVTNSTSSDCSAATAFTISVANPAGLPVAK